MDLNGGKHNMNEVQALTLQIIIISLVIAFFTFLISRYIYRKAKGLPTGECQYCHKGASTLIRKYHQMYSKKK